MSKRALADDLMAHVCADFDPDWAEKAAGLMERAAHALTAAAAEEQKRTQCCAALAEAQAEIAKPRPAVAGDPVQAAREAFRRIWPGPEIGHQAARELWAMLEAMAPADPSLTDAAMRLWWRAAGGSFHGPVTETGTMPEAKLLPLLRMLVSERMDAWSRVQDQATWLEWAMAWLRRLHEQHGGHQLADFLNNAEKAGMHKP